MALATAREYVDCIAIADLYDPWKDLDRFHQFRREEAEP